MRQDWAWTETVLYNFSGGSDGAYPHAAVAIGKGGVLFGTTFNGGTANAGTVFSLTPPPIPGGTWTESVLYSFTGKDGYEPSAGVVIGSGGEIYGTTSAGGFFWMVGGTYSFAGTGTVFNLTPPASPGGSWTERLLISFVTADHGYLSDGGNPGPLILKDGVLYGTTEFGGKENCPVYGMSRCGTVFKVSQTVLYDFLGSTTGYYPSGGVVIGSGGVLYGTTSAGGTSNDGTVFALTPQGTESVLHDLTGGSDGADPLAGVVIGSGGVLYGTTNSGTVFKLAPPASQGGAWTETVLHRFNGASPAGLVIGKNGVLFGTTSSGGSANHGSVFALKP